MAMRDRFINHYNVIVNNEEAGCLINGPQHIRKMYEASIAIPTLLKRLESKRLGVNVAKGLQRKTHQQDRLNSEGKYEAGDNTMQELAVHNMLYRTFNLPFRAVWLVTGLDSRQPIYALGINMKHIAADIADTNLVSKRIFGSHAVGFLRCKERWYYYNDNDGLFPVSYNFVKALQSALNFNDGLEHPSICIKIVEDHCYLLSLNNVKTIYKYDEFMLTEFHLTVNGVVTPATIWTESGWRDYNELKTLHPDEANKIETTKIIQNNTGKPAYYNVLTSAYCIVSNKSPSAIIRSALKIEDTTYIHSIVNTDFINILPADMKLLYSEVLIYKKKYETDDSSYQYDMFLLLHKMSSSGKIHPTISNWFTGFRLQRKRTRRGRMNRRKRTRKMRH